jgi:hypothetical protein
VPAVVVSIVVLAMGGPEQANEDEETGPTTARIELDRPPVRTSASSRLRPRPVPRTRSTSQLEAMPAPMNAAPPPRQSQVQRCCDQLRRYRRATPSKHHELYDEVLSVCDGIGDSVLEEDQVPMLDKVRSALKEKDAPYIPPPCR